MACLRWSDRTPGRMVPGPPPPGDHCTPGPSHTFTTPSENSHLTRRGVATADTSTSPTRAEPGTAPHHLGSGSTANHVSNPTTCTPSTCGEVHAPGRTNCGRKPSSTSPSAARSHPAASGRSSSTTGPTTRTRRSSVAGSPSSTISAHTGTRHRCAARAGTNTNPHAPPDPGPPDQPRSRPPLLDHPARHPVTIGVTRRPDHRPNHSPRRPHRQRPQQRRQHHHRHHNRQPPPHGRPPQDQHDTGRWTTRAEAATRGSERPATSRIHEKHCNISERWSRTGPQGPTVACGRLRVSRPKRGLVMGVGGFGLAAVVACERGRGGG